MGIGLGVITGSTIRIVSVKPNGGRNILTNFLGVRTNLYSEGSSHSLSIKTKNFSKINSTLYDFSYANEITELSIRGAARVQGLLEEHKNKAFDSREIATIKKDAPLNLDFECALI